MRTVREDSPAHEAFDEACQKWARAEDAWSAIFWTLSRDPELAGVPLYEGGSAMALTYVGARSIDMPTVVVVYEYDENYVTIREARFSQAENDCGHA